MPEDSTLHSADLESLASPKFSGLTQAEKRLLQYAQLGKLAVCGPSSEDQDPANDLAKADAWGREREIRAELIRWLCLDEHAHRRIDNRGIQVQFAKIIGTLDLSNADVPFPLMLAGCRLIDDAQLTYIKIPALNFSGSHTRCLFAERAEVKGNLTLRNSSSEGEVRLIAAKIGGTLSCDGSSFSNVRSECTDSKERNAKGKALRADRIKVDGSIFLRNGFKAEGEVILAGASVRGQLSCKGGTFRNLQGHALSAEDITVGGSVFLSDNFSSYGIVDLAGSRIGGGLDCFNGTFDTLNINMVVIKGMFVWSQIQNSNAARLDLRNAAVGALADDESSWPKSGNLHLDGFEYGRITEPPLENSFGKTIPDEDLEEMERSVTSLGGQFTRASPTDARTRLKWLERDAWFTPQPYRQLAKVLRESGDEAGSKEVLFQLKRREHGGSRRNFLTRIGDGTLEASVGYGVYPEWAALELLGLIGVSALIFWRAKRVGLMVPTDKEANESVRRTRDLPAHYPRFNPLVYAIESCVPLLKMGMADRWQADPSLPAPSLSPSARPWWSALVKRIRIHLSWASLLRVFRWFIVVLGWVLTLAFVAAVTNMFKVGQ